MGPRIAVALITVAGCGRVAFAPSPGDGGGDGTAGDGGAGTCPPFAVMCDGFESGDLSMWDGVRMNAGCTTAVNSLEVHSGVRAFDAVVAPQGGSGAICAACKEVPPQTTDMIAIRAWIYSPQPLTDFDAVLGFQSTPCSVFSNAYANAGCTGDGRWTVTENSTTGGLVDHPGTPCLAVDTWTCVELDYTFGAPSRIQLYVGDVIAVDDSADDQAPMFQRITAGVVRADAAGYHAIVDDVVVARQHIGCL